jgi:hypothetical protein
MFQGSCIYEGATSISASRMNKLIEKQKQQWQLTHKQQQQHTAAGSNQGQAVVRWSVPGPLGSQLNPVVL